MLRHENSLITWWMEILSAGRGLSNEVLKLWSRQERDESDEMNAGLSNDGGCAQPGWVLQRNWWWERGIIRPWSLVSWLSKHDPNCLYSGASLVNEGFNLLSWRNYYLRYESDRIIMATETAELILKQGDLHVDTRHSMNTILPVRVIWTHHWPFILTSKPRWVQIQELDPPE